MDFRRDSFSRSRCSVAGENWLVSSPCGTRSRLDSIADLKVFFSPRVFRRGLNSRLTTIPGQREATFLSQILFHAVGKPNSGRILQQPEPSHCLNHFFCRSRKKSVCLARYCNSIPVKPWRRPSLIALMSRFPRFRQGLMSRSDYLSNRSSHLGVLHRRSDRNESHRLRLARSNV